MNSLNLTEYGVKEIAKEGRPSYDPKGIYNLYIYGSRKGIRSLRKLAESCKVNLEVKWMLGGVEPDFRKDNIDNLKKIFHEFKKRIKINKRSIMRKSVVFRHSFYLKLSMDERECL